VSPTRREVWLGGAHLAVLWALGFVQPLFEILSESPEFFVARGNGRADVVALALGLVIVPPALMLGLEALARLVRPALGYALHLVFVALLVAALALQVLDSATGLPAGALVVFALLAGAGGAAAYAGTRFVPTVLSVLTPAPLLFLVLFLFLSPVKGIVLPHGDADALDVDVRSSAPVVMLVFDEFPSISLLDERGRIQADRYPNLARLARHATWYPNATTIADFTGRAVPSIVTGADPGLHVLPTAAAQPDNVFTLLAGSYGMDVHEGTTRLCPADLCALQGAESFPERMESLFSDLSVVSAHVLLPDAYRTGIPPVDQTFGDFAAGDLDAPSQLEAELNPALEGGRPAGRTAEVRDFIAGIGPDPATLHFLHVQIPHQPWQYLQDGTGYPSGDPSLQAFAGEHGTWTSQRWLVEHAWQRHLLQAGYADRLVGDLVAHLRRIRIFDRALVVVVADHGIAFVPGVERREVQPATVEQLAGVPLFVKAPGQRRGAVDERPALTVDVLPTIADMLGIELPFAVDGESLAGVPDEDAAAQVSVADRSGGEETLSFDDYLERRGDVVAEKLALFGSGGWDELYAFGPHSSLIGRPAPEAADAEPVFTLADPELYEDVDAGSLALPALVRGEIDGDVGPDEPIAVAVNGRVAAVGRTYEIADETLVSVIVPPSAFRDGVNEVAVARIVVGGGGPVGLETLAGPG
jgi:Sulfatase